MKKSLCYCILWLTLFPSQFILGQGLDLKIDTISITRNNPNVDVFIKALSNNQPWDLKADNIVVSEKIGANGRWVPLVIQNVAQRRKVRKEKPKPQDGNFVFLLDVSTAMTQQALTQAKSIIKKIVNKYSITETETFTIQLISNNTLDNKSLIIANKNNLNQSIDTVKLRNRAPWLYLNLKNRVNTLKNLNGKTIVILLSPGIDRADSTLTFQHLPSAPELIDQLKTLMHKYPKFYIYPISIGDSANTAFLKQLPQITVAKDDEFAKQSIPAKLNQVVQGIEEIILATHQVKVQSAECIFMNEQRYYKITSKVGTLESSEYPFKDGSQDDPIRTCYSTVSWVDSLLYLLVGLVILGVLLAFLVFFLPGIRKNRFIQKYVKPYRIEGNRRHRDQLTNRPIEEGEPSVYKCSQVTTLKTWIDFGWHCPNYPNCLNNPQFRCNGDGAPVNYQAFFDMQDSLVRKLNWLLFGAIGGFIGAAIYLGIKEIERSNASFFQQISKDFNVLNNALIGASFGIGLIFMLSWIEERGQSRNISWLRILLRTFVGAIMSAFIFVIGFYLQYKQIVTNPFIGSLLTWLLFGLGLGYVLSIQSSIPMRKALLGGLLAGLVTFGVRLLIMQISADYFYLASVLSLLCMGAVLGYTLVTIISIFEDFELEYLAPSAYYRTVSIGKWLQSGSSVTIGTAPHSNIYIKWSDEHAIPLHAQLSFENNATYLTAFAETLVNTEIAAPNQKIALNHGDIIQLGRYSKTQMKYLEKRKHRAQSSSSPATPGKAGDKGTLGANSERK